MSSKRLDTKLESDGAEFLVLGIMLVEGIVCHKHYTNSSGYDLIASNPDKNRNARIQVKSRWATDSDGGFIIKNYNSDFVVFVQLNRGYRYRKRRLAEADARAGRGAPQFYVFPTAKVKGALRNENKWGKTFLRNVEGGADSYLDKWESIRDFLGGKS
jgi:hypothetical protein